MGLPTTVKVIKKEVVIDKINTTKILNVLLNTTINLVVRTGIEPRGTECFKLLLYLLSYLTIIKKVLNHPHAILGRPFNQLDLATEYSYQYAQDSLDRSNHPR